MLISLLAEVFGFEVVKTCKEIRQLCFNSVRKHNLTCVGQKENKFRILLLNEGIRPMFLVNHVQTSKQTFLLQSV